jgi:hypothetical protein
MMKCREVSTLVSTGEVGAQPLRRRLGAILHLMMCRHCRRFRRQLRRLDRAVRAIVAGFERETPADLEGRVMERLSRPPEPAEPQ